MLTTFFGIVRDGKIEPQESASLPEGAQVLVTILGDEDGPLWQKLSEQSLKAVWENPEDDVYAELL